MGAKRFTGLYDFVRHGVNIHLACSGSPCPHTAVLDAWSTWQWARLWRWNLEFEAGVMRHFVCSKCRARCPTARPTEQAVTLVDFFPDERGWKKLQQRIRS